MKKYDAALIEKPHDEGITLQDMQEMYSLISGNETEPEVIPLDIEGEHAAAMGFIAMEAANALDYDLRPLKEQVRSILDDMELETPDRRYSFTIKDREFHVAILL